MTKYPSILVIAFVLCAILASAGCITTDSPQNTDETITITDAFGREVTVPYNPEKVAAVGSGSMRYFVYLGIDTERFVAVDFLDSKSYKSSNDLRPYILSHPEILGKEAVGPAKAVVDNERLLASGADILFMGGASSTSVEQADEVQDKTGIPVVMFYTGNYATDSEKIQASLNMIAEIFGEEKRAEELISYFDALDADLKQRAAAYSGEKPSVYVAGVAFQGSHGIDATNPSFYPFKVLSANNIVSSEVDSTGNTGYAKITKEKLLEWNPDIIFVDLATLTAAEGGAIEEMKTDPSLKYLDAVMENRIYTLNPDTAMNANHETALANAYYIGKILYPEQFADIDPVKKADEIYTNVVGKPVFNQLKEHVNDLSYQKVLINA